MSTYAEKDYVEVVDAGGDPLPGFLALVPKSWIGTDLLPKGAKAKSKAAPRGKSDDAKSGD